ncbi:MAG: helix-turn-helix transcriptional regulator [Myxococcales bacterium]|nr:helix-turn-helix transcriptional regulator [Myxococcales bacterium]
MVRAAPPGDEHGREWVSEVAVALDRASARAPAESGNTAHQAWSDLVEGRVCVVARFERDGRAFVVARRTIGTHQRRLTAREISVVQRRAGGAPLKDIAADLNLSVSTVGKALKRALGKLGLASQAELIAVLNGGSGGRPAPNK